MAVLDVFGVNVHIEGDGAGTIVMVPGWPDTYRLWVRQVEALKDRYRCVRFTLPGFDKEKPRKAYTLDEHIAFIDAVIARVSPGSASLASTEGAKVVRMTGTSIRMAGSGFSTSSSRRKGLS